MKDNACHDKNKSLPCKQEVYLFKNEDPFLIKNSFIY